MTSGKLTSGKLQPKTNVHDTTTIYADYQATTPVDPRVIEKNGTRIGENHSEIRTLTIISSVGKQTNEAVRVACRLLSVANLIGADSQRDHLYVWCDGSQ